MIIYQKIGEIEEAVLETNVLDQDTKCFEEGLQKTWTVINKQRSPQIKEDSKRSVIWILEIKHQLGKMAIGGKYEGKLGICQTARVYILND